MFCHHARPSPGFSPASNNGAARSSKAFAQSSAGVLGPIKVTESVGVPASGVRSLDPSDPEPGGRLTMTPAFSVVGDAAAGTAGLSPGEGPDNSNVRSSPKPSAAMLRPIAVHNQKRERGERLTLAQRPDLPVVKCQFDHLGALAKSIKRHVALIQRGITGISYALAIKIERETSVERGYPDLMGLIG